MGAFSDHAFYKDIAFSSDAFSFGTPSLTRARGYDPKLPILRADDEFIIEYVEDFLRRQPWRR